MVDSSVLWLIISSFEHYPVGGIIMLENLKNVYGYALALIEIIQTEVFGIDIDAGGVL